MTLDEITEQSEHAILNAVMTEMANLFPATTGLGYAIWFGEVGGQHGPRIKVSNIRGRFAQNDNFVISVDKNPRILTPRSVKLKPSEVEDIFDWVKLNYQKLMEMWKIYESGDGKPEEIISTLDKL